MKRAAGVLLPAILAACSGGPIREKPLFEPPPAVEAAPVPDLVGAWTSISLQGPGSASFRRIDLVFHRDGRWAGVAEGPSKAEALAGRYVLADGALSITLDQGEALRFDSRFEGGVLILSDRGSELRLAPLRN